MFTKDCKNYMVQIYNKKIIHSCWTTVKKDRLINHFHPQNRQRICRQFGSEIIGNLAS